MSLLKRTFTSFFSRVDQAVGEMENHDALIQAAIKEQRKKICSAKVELARIKKHEEKVNEQIQQLEKNRTLWSQRAVKEAALDEAKALACMQQRESITEQASKLKSMLKQYQSTSNKMQQNIKRGDQELQELTQKHHIMRARQSTTEVLNKLAPMGGANLDDLETSFDRWEVKISQGEYTLGNEFTDTETDDLEKIYIEQENKENLRVQLSTLLNQELGKKLDREREGSLERELKGGQKDD